ncbi:MAG TPA: DUF72 domain-containing protein [Steroidobacteraceae bacterium]|nr:DUF72 domain-containing protein [Steroidobacteraceae bacterium]
MKIDDRADRVIGREGAQGKEAMSISTPQVRIGVSGWRYEPWRGVFYPADLQHRLELRYAASIFRTLEINGSFYSLQRPASWRQWYADVPAGFVFAVKGPRYLTHMLKLREIEQPLANFLASGVLALNEKLGPILWQFPPQMRFDPERFEPFLSRLPKNTADALAMARTCDARMRGRSHLAIDSARTLRHAVEIRHESFLDPRFVAMLRAHGVALVIAETARKWPMPRDVTADFMYLRLHGDKELYRSGYRPAAIRRWADRIRAWHEGGEPASLPPGAVRIAEPATRARAGRDVYCFFDNTDVKLRAPADAQSLMRCLGQVPGHSTETTVRTTQPSPARRATSPAVAGEVKSRSKRPSPARRATSPAVAGEVKSRSKRPSPARRGTARAAVGQTRR